MLPEPLGCHSKRNRASEAVQTGLSLHPLPPPPTSQVSETQHWQSSPDHPASLSSHLISLQALAVEELRPEAAEETRSGAEPGNEGTQGMLEFDSAWTGGMKNSGSSQKGQAQFVAPLQGRRPGSCQGGNSLSLPSPYCFHEFVYLSVYLSICG